TVFLRAFSLRPGFLRPGSLRTLPVRGLAAMLWFAVSLSAAAQIASPESLGLSAERLTRINDLVQSHIDAGRISGAVTLVARHGQIAHLEAQGVMDLATGKPMETDTIFRLASMSKPVAGLAIMM